MCAVCLVTGSTACNGGRSPEPEQPAADGAGKDEARKSRQQSKDEEQTAPVAKSDATTSKVCTISFHSVLVSRGRRCLQERRCGHGCHCHFNVPMLVLYHQRSRVGESRVFLLQSAFGMIYVRCLWRGHRRRCRAAIVRVLSARCSPSPWKPKRLRLSWAVVAQR